LGNLLKAGSLNLS